jgi:signal recognition particle subunit SRP54
MGGGGGLGGLLGNVPGMKNLALARNMRRAMKSGKMPPGMPDMNALLGGGGMPGMPPGMGFPGMGMPGMGMPGLGGMPGAGPNLPKRKTLSKAEKNARKNSRKNSRTARKKSKK